MKNSTESSTLCLASHSPRRRTLLERLGVSFFVQAAGPEVEEKISSTGQGECAQEVALARATIKGRDVSAGLPGVAVLSADTVVHLDDVILDKPADADEARSFLRQLSNREHGVVTGLWLFDGSKERTVWRRTLVKFTRLDDEMIARYVATGEPFDKAGGYGIQGVGGALIERIQGCYFNVMGLPLFDTGKLLSEVGIPWELDRA